MLFASRGAKASISHYKKGDAIIVHAHLRSLREKNPVDPTKSYNVQMLVVDSFMATPGTHLRNEISKKFANADKKEKYHSIKDILSDETLSQEQQDKLIAKFARAEFNPIAQNSAAETSQLQQYSNGYDESLYQEPLLPASDEDPNNDYDDSRSLSDAFKGEYE